MTLKLSVITRERMLSRQLGDSHVKVSYWITEAYVVNNAFIKQFSLAIVLHVEQNSHPNHIIRRVLMWNRISS